MPAPTDPAPGTRQPVVCVEGLRKSFGDLLVLDSVDLDVAPHESIAIIGPSGSGKSTLLRCIGGLEQPDAGKITIDEFGLDASLPAREVRAAVRSLRGRCGMVFQSFNLFPHKTAIENIMEAPRVVLGDERDALVARAEALLDRVGLADKRDEYPSRLSGGQQQRVAIARSLAMNPRVMLFDEPTSALDPELIGEVQSVIRDLVSDGLTALIVTHEMRFAAELAREVVFMDAGRVVERASPETFFSDPETDRAQRFLRRIGDGSSLRSPADAPRPVGGAPR